MAETQNLKKRRQAGEINIVLQKFLSPISGDANATTVARYELQGTRYERGTNVLRHNSHFVLNKFVLNVKDYEQGRDATCDVRGTMRQTLVPRKSYLVLKIYVSQKPPWLHTQQALVRCML